MRRRHELTDAQWERVRDLLPAKAADPGRTAADNRLFVDAVLYVLKTGVPWADLPPRFGKPNTLWRRQGRRCAAGVWQRIAAELGEGAGEVEEVEEVQLGSTGVKAHPTASAGRRLPAGKKPTPTPAAASGGRAGG